MVKWCLVVSVGVGVGVTLVWSGGVTMDAFGVAVAFAIVLLD